MQAAGAQIQVVFEAATLKVAPEDGRIPGEGL